MTALGARRDGHSTVLICRVGELWCALPIEHVIETMRPMRIDAVAGAPGFVIGVSIVRGRPLPVLDARRLLGQPDAEAPSRFVTLALGSRAASLAVDAVCGVRSLDGTRTEPLPPLLDRVGSHTVASITRLDADLLLVLDASRLVPAAETSVAAEAAR